MNYDSKFQIKYWGNDDYYQEPPARSIKKKLLIVSTFVGILAIIPLLIYGLSSLSKEGERISISKEVPAKPKEIVREPSVAPTKAPEKNLGPQGEIVINNDSYWKISKRHCGTGRYYLSIRDQNNGKPLYKGDFVSVSCN